MADDQRSLPLAPPAFVHPSASGSAQTPLSNADFRKVKTIARASLGAR